MARGSPDWLAPSGAYYDRSPVSDNIGYTQGSVGPHAATERDSYTVPAGKKAFFDFAFIELFRSAATTTTASAHAWITYTPSGGATRRIIMVHLGIFTAGGSARHDAGAIGALMPGDEIAVHTADANSDGTVDYTLTAKYVEFDA